MKHIQLSSLVLTLLLTSTAHSYLPDPQIPLADHIKTSDQIFVGAAVDVYFVSPYGRRLTAKEVAKQVRSPGFTPLLETKLRVRETLLSRTGKLPNYVYFRSFTEENLFYLKEAGITKWLKKAKDYDSKPFIYFTRGENYLSKPVLVASDGTVTYREMNEKANIKDTIEGMSNSMRLLN